jgi:prophage maintenance system killer protein
MSDLWTPEVEDFIEAHEQAGKLSKIRTSGYMHSKDEGIRKLEEIVKKINELQEPYNIAAYVLKETVLKQPFSDGNHRTGLIVAKQVLRKNGEDFTVSKIRSIDDIKEFMKWELKNSEIEEIAEWIRNG